MWESQANRKITNPVDIKRQQNPLWYIIAYYNFIEYIYIYVNILDSLETVVFLWVRKHPFSWLSARCGDERLGIHSAVGEEYRTHPGGFRRHCTMSAHSFGPVLAYVGDWTCVLSMLDRFRSSRICL